MTAYVTQAEVLASFETPPDSASRLARITTLITSASDELDAEVGFTFERTPAALTSTFLVRGHGGPLLHLHGDGLPLAEAPTSISFAAGYAGTLTLIGAADYAVEQWDAASGQYDHVRLLGATSGYGAFPIGHGLVSIVGARGFAVVPPNVKTAVIDRVRQLYHADPTLIGGVMGPEEGGRIVISTRPPDTFYRVVEHYRRRYATCWV